MTNRYEVRESTVGPGWKAIYEHVPGTEEAPPESRLLVVMEDANLRELTRTLGKHRAAQIAEADTARKGETCGAQPSKASTARCENPKGHAGPHSGQTPGGRWKHWNAP
jgi:hypothetical protein